MLVIKTVDVGVIGVDELVPLTACAETVLEGRGDNGDAVGEAETPPYADVPGDREAPATVCVGNDVCTTLETGVEAVIGLVLFAYGTETADDTAPAAEADVVSDVEFNGVVEGRRDGAGVEGKGVLDRGETIPMAKPDVFAVACGRVDEAFGWRVG